jgi:DUF4097 and DUF4098 domain-containing protein YvlB
MRRLLVTILLTLAATTAAASELRETIDRTFDVRPGATLSVDNVNGRVEVNSWDQPKIRVRAEKKAEGRDGDDVKQAMAEMKVDIMARPDGVSVKTTEPDKALGFLDAVFGHHVNRSVHYEITVPRNANLKLETVNGGVYVDNVNGSLNLDTTNGKIQVARCSGSIDASTTNGGIQAELLSVTAGKSMRFETTNGHITVVLPSTFAAEVDASTTNGRISTDLPVLTRTFDKNTLRGTVNGGGGAILRLRTTNGGIDIKSKNPQQASR